MGRSEYEFEKFIDANRRASERGARIAEENPESSRLELAARGGAAGAKEGAKWAGGFLFRTLLRSLFRRL